MYDNMITTGNDRTIIDSMLDHNRSALIDTVRGLSETNARRRLVPSLTTPISLIKHAAAAERIWFQRHWGGLDENQCDGYSRRDQGTFTVGDHEKLPDVVTEFERASILSRDIASQFDHDDSIDLPDAEGVVTMRWTLLLMIQEFARHAGHGGHSPRANRCRRNDRHNPLLTAHRPSSGAVFCRPNVSRRPHSGRIAWSARTRREGPPHES